MSKEFSFNLLNDKEYKSEWDKLTKIENQISEAEEEVQKLSSEGVLEAIQDERKLRVKAILNGKNPDLIDVSQVYRASLQKANQRIYLLKDAKEEQKNILDERLNQSMKK